MRPHLNLASRIYVNRQKVTVAVRTAIGILIVIFAVLAGQIFGTRSEIGTAEKEAVRLDARMKKPSVTFTDKEYSALLDRVKVANGIIQRKSIDWIALLNHLEGVVPDGASVLSVQPEPQNGSLKIGAAAARFDNLRHTVENFQSSTVFRDVLLLDHVQVKEQDATVGFTFTLSCRVDYQSL